jgi:hypothetical protein
MVAVNVTRRPTGLVLIALYSMFVNFTDLRMFRLYDLGMRLSNQWCTMLCQDL